MPNMIPISMAGLVKGSVQTAVPLLIADIALFEHGLRRRLHALIVKAIHGLGLLIVAQLYVATKKYHKTKDKSRDFLPNNFSKLS
jgi:formate hydrogenlyase subunit 3/multisubunit Na+/H+ antiporter MnhD subunit